jgi:F0F1-type ATP synthase membrane subunit b/b'
MARIRDDLKAASDELSKALDSAGDELKSGVQRASSQVSRLIDDIEAGADEAEAEVHAKLDDLLADVEGLIERADEETTAHLESVRDRLRDAKED